jgi:hypothetical protein
LCPVNVLAEFLEFWSMEDKAQVREGQGRQRFTLATFSIACRHQVSITGRVIVVPR